MSNTLERGEALQGGAGLGRMRRAEKALKRAERRLRGGLRLERMRRVEEAALRLRMGRGLIRFRCRGGREAAALKMLRLEERPPLRSEERGVLRSWRLRGPRGAGAR